jgi:transposase
MQDVTLIGIDLGKHSFHVHGQDRHGKALLRKKFSRKQLIEFFATFHTCTVVMEACAGAHYMARQLAGYGHAVKLISPQFVRPFVKSNKNDFVDAEAICEAASRPSMRFVTPKNEAQQVLSALHRVRESLIRERTKASNQIHGFLLEFGVSLPIGVPHFGACRRFWTSRLCPLGWFRSSIGCRCTSSIWTSKSPTSRRN